MKNLFILSLLLGCFTSMVVAQKTNQLKYRGNYNSIKVLDFGTKGYNITVFSSPEVKAVIDKGKLEPMKIKGLSEGDDYKIVVYIADPVVTPSIEKETSNVNNQSITQFFARLSIDSQSEAFVLNKEGLPIYSFKVQTNDFFSFNDGMKKSTYEQAKEDLNYKIKESSKFARENYIHGVYNAFIKELSNQFGNQILATTFRINTIESKKFDYSEFNQASADFQRATEPDYINTDEAKNVITNTIAIWKKFADEYQADKKAKINDDNIDEIYLNIAMGYLVLGDGQNLKAAWEKCLSIKGNYSQENYARQFVTDMITNYNKAIAANKELNTPKSFIPKERQFNNMIVLKGILNHYLSEKQGNLGVAMNYFPGNEALVASYSSVKDFGHDYVENYTIQYAPFGKISQLKYAVKGSIGGNKEFVLGFENNEFGITKIFKDNNLLLFSANYKDGRIADITYHATNTKKLKYTFDYSLPGQVVFDLTIITDGIAKAEKTSTYLVFNENMQITSMRFNPYLYYDAKYDNNGNLLQMGASNAADESVTIRFTHQYDAKGNATETKTNGQTQKSEIDYFL